MKVKTLTAVYEDVKQVSETLDEQANEWFSHQDMNAIRIVSVTNELLYEKREIPKRVAMRMIHYTENKKR
jgi:hypothetical protein